MTASRQDENFSTELDAELLSICYAVGAVLGMDPLSSTEAEAYFLNLQRKIQAGEETLKNVERILHQEFISLSMPPVWIQNPEWQYESEVPMIFVGQIEAPHDSIVGEKGFYVFHGKNSNTVKVVVQYG